jgi:hypothetical protein
MQNHKTSPAQLARDLFCIGGRKRKNAYLTIFLSVLNLSIGKQNNRVYNGGIG